MMDGAIDSPSIDWERVPRRTAGFTLDVGFATPPRVPNWMLPAGTAAEPHVSLLDLPVRQGYVLSSEIDTDSLDTTLLAYYRQMPRLPPARLRHETERFNCFAVDVLLDCPPQHGMMIEMFGGGRGGAGDLLIELADIQAAPSVAYDNLDQGWALIVRIERDDVLFLEWDWERDNPARRTQALRLARAEVARQAAAARARLDRLHTLLLAGVGADLWQAGVR